MKPRRPVSAFPWDRLAGLLAVALLAWPSVPAGRAAVRPDLDVAHPEVIVPGPLPADLAPPAVPRARGLLAGPYLGQTTPDSVVVSWATDDEAASELRYSLDHGYGLTAVAVDQTLDGKYWHAAAATGLAAGATYFYRVYTGGVDVTGLAEASFATAPAGAEPLTFIAFGDSRPWDTSALPSAGAVAVAAALNLETFDLAVHVGDIVYAGGICSGADSSWNQYLRAYFDLYGEILARRPVYPSIGNHELNGETCGYQAYKGLFELPANAPAGHEEEYYSFDWGLAHFVALDTTQDYAPGSTQYNWLESDLAAAAGADWTFVFFHHPAYSGGAHGSEAAVQAYLVPLLQQYGVEAVFNGHDHDYERACPVLDGACSSAWEGGVTYLVVGGGGAPLYGVAPGWWTVHAESIYSYLRVQVTECQAVMDAVDTSGAVIDSFIIDKCSSPTPTPSPTITPTPAPLVPALGGPGAGLLVLGLAALLAAAGGKGRRVTLQGRARTNERPTKEAEGALPGAR